MRKLLVVLASGGLLGLLAVSPASAAGLTAPVADCNAHARLTHSYSAAQLRSSLATMPADIREYSNCYNLIQQALLQKIGKLPGAGGSDGGGSFLPMWLIVVILVLVLGGAGLGVLALRNRERAP